MSDGPHKSLPMRRAWKRLAMCADNEAFAPEDVSGALADALRQDWKAEALQQLVRRLDAVVGDDGSGLFEGRRFAQLDAERAAAGGHPLSCLLIDCVIHELRQGCWRKDTLREAAVKALVEWAARHARQIEEHYKRRSDRHRAGNVRERLEASVAKVDMQSLAKTPIRAGRDQHAHAPAKYAGLDDGVKL